MNTFLFAEQKSIRARRFCCSDKLLSTYTNKGKSQGEFKDSKGLVTSDSKAAKTPGHCSQWARPSGPAERPLDPPL